MPEIKKKIIEICNVCKSNKQLTKEKLFKLDNNYPVYAGSVGTPIGYADESNNSVAPALIVVNDGAAGKTYLINDEKYVIGKHATGLTIKEEYINQIDIRYLQYIAEPIFVNKNKTEGRGNLPKAEILNTYVPIPTTESGEIDFKTQKAIADNIDLIDEKRNVLEESKHKLSNIYIRLEMLNDLPIKEISLNEYFDLKRGKVISKQFMNMNKGDYPVYSTQSGVFGYINSFMENGKYLLWNTDGLAGYIKITSGPFSYTNIVGIMIPKKNINKISLEYLKYYLEPIFRLNKKGREGINGKNEYTKLNSTMIKNLDIKIPIPIDAKGEFDLDIQNAIANKYCMIEEVKNNVINKIDRVLINSVI